MGAAGLLGASARDDGASTRYWRVEPFGPILEGSLSNVVAADANHPLAAIASAVLSRVRLAPSALMQGEPDAGAALCIGRDGTFCAGVLRGRAAAANDSTSIAPAIHIGARQRRAAALARAQLLDDEATLAASEERALREFVIGRLPNAIGTAWTRLRDWVVEVNGKMQSAAASSGVGVQVRIPLREDLPPASRDVHELSCKVSSAERTPEQERRLSHALRSLLDAAPGETMQERVAAAVDIRDWVEVYYEVMRPGGKRQRWNKRTGLSGGERRLVVLAPMLAAIAAAYDRFGSNALRLVTLDEVPAEVDDRGREGLARYSAALDLDLVCTSYLWDGCPGAWDGIEAYDLEAGTDGTVVGFPMLVRGLSPIPQVTYPS